MSYQTQQPTSFGRRGIDKLDKVEKAPRVERTNVDEIDISSGMVLAYIGHNAHKYVAVVDALEQKHDGFRGIALSWNWPALFFTDLWLLYRKRWAAAAGMIFLTMIMAFMFPKQSIALLPFRIVLATMAKSLYVNSAAGHIKRIVARQTDAAFASVAIRKAGGVSPGAVWLYIGIWFAIVLIIGIQAAITHHGVR